mmetsp:Transcript_38559/g.81953  ORF Transcript_38559/g.81953 Transcript_38559/m.81953 type:complete len:302 (-) Transcript_38559:39-944(-)
MAKEEVLDTAPYTSGDKIGVGVEYNTRDLIIYALGIGSRDPRFVYEANKEFAAFPTYPIVLTFKGESFNTLPFPPPAMQEYPLPPLPGFSGIGLDAEKLIEKVAELPKAGAKLKLLGKVAGVHSKGKGALVERLFELVDDAGKVYYNIVDATFMLGCKNFKDSGRTFSKNLTPPASAPMHSVETPTDEHIPSLYRLSGDYNPLHVDPQFAKFGGFDKPIMHGQCTMGHVTRALLDTLAGGDQGRFKSVQLRFASPVFPGQTLLTEVWKTSPTEFIFHTKVKETGKVCVSNGLFVLTPEGKL